MSSKDTLEKLIFGGASSGPKPETEEAPGMDDLFDAVAPNLWVQDMLCEDEKKVEEAITLLLKLVQSPSRLQKAYELGMLTCCLGAMYKWPKNDWVQARGCRLLSLMADKSE